MADTIGWGDGGLEPPPTRLHRVLGSHSRRVVVLTVIAAVVAGIVLWPTVRSRLADRAATWLQKQWLTARAYDDFRQRSLATAMHNAGREDGELLGHIVASLDREEAQQLRRIAKAVANHRTYASDVGAAARAVRRALIAQAADLESDATSSAPVLASFSAPFELHNTMSAQTVALGRRATELLHAATARRGAKPVRPAPVRLASASGPIAMLARVTSRPLQTKLVVLHDGLLDVWDLRSGDRQPHVSASSVGSFDEPFQRVGESLLVRGPFGRWRLAPIADGRAVVLPVSHGYFAAGNVGVWQIGGHSVRRFDAYGRPVSRAYALPPGMGVMGASAEAVVLVKLNVGPPPVFVWTPSSGRLVRAANASAMTVTGTDCCIAFLTRDGRAISVMDTGSGRVAVLRVPQSLEVYPAAGMLLSPDGQRVAAAVAPVDAIASQFDLAVFDVRSGKATIVAQPAVPLAWSPDSSVVIANSNYDHGERSSDPEALAYWTEGMTRLESIRVPGHGFHLYVTTAPAK